MIVGASFPIYKNKKEQFVRHCYAKLISEGSSDTRYTATCEGKSDDQNYKMDHLMIVRDRNNLKWKQPPKSDLLNLHLNSIVDCKNEGEWNVFNERSFSL